MERPTRLTIALVALAGMPVAAFGEPRSAGPTFDCERASGQVETLICKDAGLAALDRRMAEVYAAAIEAWPANIAAEQRAYQRGWIKGSNDCWKADDPRACTELAYRTRIVELQIKCGQLTAPTPIGYACTGAEGRPFFASFYPQTDPPSAVLTCGAFVRHTGWPSFSESDGRRRDLRIRARRTGTGPTVGRVILEQRPARGTRQAGGHQMPPTKRPGASLRVGSSRSLMLFMSPTAEGDE
jgi:uncharacterized protein